MKKSTFFKMPLGAIFVIFLVFSIFGCSGSRPGMGLDDGETLSPESGEFGELTPIDSRDSSDLQSDEDEVLRLLGISRDEKKAPAPSPKVQPPQPTSNTAGVGVLKSELDNRETEISSLRSDLKTKQDRIDELESKLKKQSGLSMVPGLTPMTPTEKSTYKERYQAALQMYNERRYREAITAFESLLATDMSSSLADNAQYWIGECYYGLGNFNQAIVEFEKVFSFSQKDKYDDTLLKIGLCYMRLGENAKAKIEFERLISDFPNSEYVTKAEAYMRKL